MKTIHWAMWAISFAIVVALLFVGIRALDRRLVYLEANPEVGKINCTYSVPEKHCFRYAYRSMGEVACERNTWDYYYNISYCSGEGCGLLCNREIYGERMIR